MVIRPLSKRAETILAWVLWPVWFPLFGWLYLCLGVERIARRIGRWFWRDRTNWTPCFAWWPTWCEDPDSEEWPQTVWLETIERCEIQGTFAHQRYVAYRRRRA